MSSETKENEEIIEETHLPNDYREELIDDAEMENAGGNENDFSVNNQAVDETNSGGNRDSDADEAGEANVIEGNGREEDELSESHRENNSSDSADVNLIEGDDKKQEGSSEPNCESNSSGNADDTADVDLIEGDDKKQDGSFEPRCEPVIDANTSVNGSEIDGLVGEAEADVIEESKNISEQKMALYGKEFENGENVKKRKSVDNGMEFENGVFVRKFEEETTKKRKSEVNGMYVARGMVLARAERNIMKQEMVVHEERVGRETPKTPCPFGPDLDLEELSGTEEEQVAFLMELESFYREEKNSDFKPLKFYGKELNCLQLWKAVTRLGGYDQVTGCKLWKHVGGTFNPPKTCTTVSWTFRGFYEKALLDYERYKTRDGDGVPFAPLPDSMSVESQIGASQPSGSGRVRRESATRAMQGWHSQRLLANGEVGDPVIKDKSIVPMPMHEKQIETDGAFKSKKLSNIERGTKSVHTTPKASKLQMDIKIDHIGPPADWVKINVRRTKDCFEVYALVPGLLREEVRVQSDPAGRLVISGEPEKPDNPWGVTPFKKVVTLPSRIDPVHTSAVVTLHGQLFVRAPFEQSYK